MVGNGYFSPLKNRDSLAIPKIIIRIRRSHELTKFFSITN